MRKCLIAILLTSTCAWRFSQAQVQPSFVNYWDVPTDFDFSVLPHSAMDSSCEPSSLAVPLVIQEMVPDMFDEVFTLTCWTGPRLTETLDLLVFRFQNNIFSIITSYSNSNFNRYYPELSSSWERRLDTWQPHNRTVFSYTTIHSSRKGVLRGSGLDDDGTRFAELATSLSYKEFTYIYVLLEDGIRSYKVPTAEYTWYEDEEKPLLHSQLAVNTSANEFFVTALRDEITPEQQMWVGTISLEVNND